MVNARAAYTAECWLCSCNLSVSAGVAPVSVKVALLPIGHGSEMLAALAMVVPADRPWQMAKSPELAFDHNCDIENCLGSGHPAAQSCWMI